MGTSGFGEGPGATGPAGPTGPAAAEPEAGLPAERLLLFTDAVAAISITLLILPLVDLVPEAASGHETARQVVTDHSDQFWSFLLSFAVVARFWFAHHRAFSAVGALNRPLVMWNMGWLLSIVALPFPTEIIGAFGHQRFAAGLYYANLLATLICQAAMLWVVRAHPETLTTDDAGSRARVAGAYTDSLFNVAALVVAFAVALAVPALQYWSLALLAVFPRLVPPRWQHPSR